MSETPNSEPPLAAPDDMPEDMPEDTLHVSSLRPTPSAFSTRRLLNWASLAVAALLLLALAIHWLPSILPAKPPAQPTSFSFTPLTHAPTNTPSTQGFGWKPIGPDWAQQIVFTSNGALGYVCGAFPPNPIVLFGVYDVHQNAWRQTPTPATGSSCRITVSPVNTADVVLIVDQCLYPACPHMPPSSHAYHSMDGGSSWKRLNVPPSLLVGDIAWTSTSTLFLGAANYTTTSPPYSLFVSHPDGSLTTVDARQLVGRSMELNYISLLSSGATLYASITGLSCASYCTTWLRTNDDGRHWTPLAGSYQGNPIAPQAAQPYSNVLVGLSVPPESGILTPLRSTDSGAHWTTLPPFPANPSTGGANIYILPNGTVYAFCYGDASVVYALHGGVGNWQTIAPLPDGSPLAVQYDVSRHVVALWGQAHTWSAGSLAPGLEYNPLVGSEP